MRARFNTGTIKWPEGKGHKYERSVALSSRDDRVVLAMNVAGKDYKIHLPRAEAIALAAALQGMAESLDQ